MAHVNASAVGPTDAGLGSPWHLQRPDHVSPSHWHQEVLHACSQARIDGLVRFVVGPDRASFWLAPGHVPVDPAGRPAVLTQLLAEVAHPASQRHPANAPKPQAFPFHA